MTTYLCDVGVWVALAVEPHVHHAAARAWFDEIREPRSIVFCRATQQGFLRLLTTAAVMAPYGLPPLNNNAAWDAYQAMRMDVRVTFRSEPEGLDAAWRVFCLRPSASPKLWMDAYLAAFARSDGSTMVSTDTAFRQFAGLDLLVLGRGGST